MGRASEIPPSMGVGRPTPAGKLHYATPKWTGRNLPRVDADLRMEVLSLFPPMTEHNTDEATLVYGGRLRVGLSQDDWDFIEELAEKRNASYERDCFDSHRTGIAGELAYARAFDNELDTSIYQHGDGGVDFVHRDTPEGEDPELLDVKTRTHYDGWLIVSEDTLRQTPADVFVLVVVEDTFADIVGWASVDKLWNGQRRDGYGGKCRALPQDALTDLPGVRG